MIRPLRPCKPGCPGWRVARVGGCPVIGVCLRCWAAEPVRPTIAYYMRQREVRAALTTGAQTRPKVGSAAAQESSDD